MAMLMDKKNNLSIIISDIIAIKNRSSVGNDYTTAVTRITSTMPVKMRMTDPEITTITITMTINPNNNCERSRNTKSSINDYLFM